MGMHTIQFTWNIVVRESHTITVTRIGHIWTDTLEVSLDGKTVMSRIVDTLTAWGIFRGKQKLTVEDHAMEIWWKFDGQKADPESIMLMDDNKIIAQYGKNSAIKSQTASEAISPGNKIELIGPEDYVYFSSPSLIKWLYRQIGEFGSPTLFPISIKKGYETQLSVLGQQVGFQDEGLFHRLAIHDERLKKWRKAINSIGLLFIFPIVILLSLALFFIIDETSWTYNFQNYIFLMLVFYLLFYFVFTMLMKAAYWFASRNAIETLCVATIMYILVELKADDALVHMDRKQVLLARIGYLARQTMRLARHYPSKSLKNQQWVEKHFRYMEIFIREHERWIYTPVASTLYNLRQDFFQLATIYISGLYGEFTYQPNDNITSKEQSNKRDSSEGRMIILRKSMLIFFGIVLPGLLFLLIPIFPTNDDKIFGLVEPKVASAALFTLLSLGVERVFNVDSSPEPTAKAGEPLQPT
jgi:hypothetical protein